MLVVLGTKASFAGAPAVAFKVAVALVSPASRLPMMVALPTVVGVRLDAAIPPLV